MTPQRFSLPVGLTVPVIVGPTGSGKTDLALALAERLGGEILSIDSVQVYRRFDVGSGKPTPAERTRVPYHLIDVADAHDPLDAGSFVTLADEILTDILARGRIPILCGGTFLWVRAVLYGLAPSAPSSPEIRTQHRELVASEGPEVLYEQLRAVDPVAAARWSPRDVLRTSRALEVFVLTGRPMSEVQAQHGFSLPRFPFQLLGVDRDRTQLAARIAARTRAWLANGWEDEVRGLLADGYGDVRPLQSVGYRQVAAHVQGEGRADGTPGNEENKRLSESLAESIDRATQQFVRRQRTWLRDEAVRWLAPETPLEPVLSALL